MSWRYYDFECVPCGQPFEDLVQGTEGEPDACKHCGGPGPFKRLVAGAVSLTTIIPSYPGSKRNTAGYGHELRRPAEKAGRQVSMHGSGGIGSK